MPSNPSMICQERTRLLRDYSDAATSYSEKVREMADLALAGRDTESNAARRLCRTAWDTAESSRLALSRHEIDHSCDRASESCSVEDLDTL
jgi:hypothetical protein